MNINILGDFQKNCNPQKQHLMMIWNMLPRYKARSIGCTGGLLSAARVQFGLQGKSDYVGERTTLRSMQSRFVKVSPSLASASTAYPSHDISFMHRNNYDLLATSISGLDYSICPRNYAHLPIYVISSYHCRFLSPGQLGIRLVYNQPRR